MSKNEIQRQFGAHAADYVVSQTHARGASLERLLELVDPQPHWKVLDIAAATGHTAFTFAPHVAHVWATDITPEMLTTAQEQARQRGISNITVEFADAEDLPYPEASFDLVTCRIAPHHFPDVGRFVRQAARVLTPGGLLANVDNVVPPGPAGDYVNAFEKLRDPSHERCLTVAEWLALYGQAGLRILQRETLDKQVDFEFWAKRHDPATRQFLRTMLTHAPETAREFLQPQTLNGQTTFRLQEGLLIGKKG